MAVYGWNVRSAINTAMAAHKHWRIRVHKDSNVWTSSDGYYVNFRTISLLDANGVAQAPVRAHSSGTIASTVAKQAFDTNTSDYFGLSTDILRSSGGYAWVSAHFAEPIEITHIGIRTNTTNTPRDFSIDYSDDEINWVNISRHRMGGVNTETFFPTGIKIAKGNGIGEFPIWRIRIIKDTSGVNSSTHVMNFKQVKFIDDLGNTRTPMATFSSPYVNGQGTPTQALGSGQTSIVTDDLYGTPEGDCFLGIISATPFRPTKIQFQQSGVGSLSNMASFVIEGSTNGRHWFTEDRFNNVLIPVDTLVDLSIKGGINSIMSIKKITDLEYSDISAAQSKDALVAISGVGDEADTLYRVTLADLAAMLTNSDAIGQDYHKEHRGWRVVFGDTVAGGGPQAIGDLTFIDRSGGIIQTTGGIPYAYNGSHTGAFDGSPLTGAESTNAASGSTPSGTSVYGVGYIFANAVDVGSVNITPKSGSITQAPKNFAVQYSDDNGISWTSFASFDNVTDWTTGTTKQFHLPSVGISTSGINYGKDFWRSLDFTTATTMYNSANVYPCSQIINGSAIGRRIVIEAMVRKASGSDIGLYVGDVGGAKAYRLTAHSNDSNMVQYSQAALSNVTLVASATDAALDYTGWYHFKLEMNIADVATQLNTISGSINGVPLPTATHSLVNLAQDLKVFVQAGSVDDIKWVHYRWDDNGIDIPVVGEVVPVSGGGSGGDTLIYGETNRFYRLGGFAVGNVLTNETILMASSTDNFIFPEDFAGSTGSVTTPPENDFTLLVTLNDDLIGNITVGVDSGVSFSTIDGDRFTVGIGDTVKVIAPEEADELIAGLSFTLLGVTGTSLTYMGARVGIAIPTVIANGARMVSWSKTEHDVGGFYNAALPMRLTVPEGVTRVRIDAGILFGSTSSSSTAWLGIQKNHFDVSNTTNDHYVAIAKVASEDFADASATVSTGVLTVNEGDFFTLRVAVGGDDSVNIQSAATYFSIEAVDGPALLRREHDIVRPQYLVEPSYRFGFYFEHTPEESERIGIHVASDDFTFPAGFSGSIGSVETYPVNSYPMKVQLNGVDIGTITVGSAGAVGFYSDAAIAVTRGDRIALVASAVKDTVISGGAFTFKGTFE